MNKTLIEKWKRKVEDIRYDPPINYRLIFNEAVRNYSNKNYSFLDIGTGTGKVIFDNELSGLYNKVVGIDIEDGMIRMCKEKTREMQVKNAEFYVMDSTKRMDFSARSFNVIAAMFAPYNPNEVSRLLTKNGYFVLLWGLKGDHKEITDLFPEIFDLWDGRLYFETYQEREKRLGNAGLEIVGHNALQYTWIFRDESTLKEFYEKILLTPLFNGKENRLKKLKKYDNGEIPVTRIIGTTIAKKI